MSQQIIMNFTVPPGEEDLCVLAQEIMETIPEEMAELCESTVIEVEDFPDEATMSDLALDDSYELLALFRKGTELSPGVESKVANDDDILMLYRRPILDLWCETGSDLEQLLREAIIEELGRVFDFSDEEITEMSSRHHQGLL